MIHLRKMSWVWHVRCIGREKGHTVFWWLNLRERGHLGDPGIDRIKLSVLSGSEILGYGLDQAGSG